MKELFLLRGIPGSGKSTLAQSLGGKHLEADMYFVDKKTGAYNFDHTLLSKAHAWCQGTAANYMLNSEHRVVISNTFTQEWEMHEYTNLAKKHGYTVYSLVVENRHNGINSHGVPLEVLDQMESRFELKLR
jgi:predicted kinase